MNWQDFHFIQPQWLWAIAPVLLLAIGYWQRGGSTGDNDWAAYIDAHLLAALSLSTKPSARAWLLPWLTLLAALATVIALAGPAWEKVKVPSFSGGKPIVMVLSLAQSMNADDVKPNRLKRAEHKIRDILAKTQGDERALVIYADTAFVAAPLTNDANIIEQMLPQLSTTLMPVLGNRLDIAIETAVGLLQRGQAHDGQLIVLTDSAGQYPKLSQTAAQTAKDSGYQLSVIGIGTKDGATLQTADGRAINNARGQTVITQLAEKDLQALAQVGGGRFVSIQADDSDIQTLLKNHQVTTAQGKAQDFHADTWKNQGYWLLILPVLVLPWFFRRGVLASVILCLTGLTLSLSPPAAMADKALTNQIQPYADSRWDKLWKNNNQRGEAAFAQGDFQHAEKLFDKPKWKAAAQYKAGNYADAARLYQQLGDDYNHGQSLFELKDWAGALTAFKKTLEKTPNNKSAQIMAEITQRMLEEEKKQQDKQQQDKQQQDKQQQDKQQQDKQQQDKQQQDKQQQDKQQQDKQQQDKQQQDKQQQDKQQQDKQQQDKQQQDKQQQDKQQQDKQQQDKQQQDKQQQDKQQQDKQQQDKQQQDKQQQDKQQQDKQQQDKQQQDKQQQDKQQDNVGEKPLFEWENKTKDDEKKAPESKKQPLGQPLDQATEQQLRRVPDDPFGLLQRRIRQHYLRQQMMGQ